MTDFAISCSCNCPGNAPTGGQNQIIVVGGDINAWRQLAAKGGVTNVLCNACGCKQHLIDTGGGLGTSDASQPKLTSISVSRGTRGGGTAVTLTGHRLDFGALVVRFDGVPALNLRARSDAHATVDTPAHVPGTVAVTVENEHGQRPFGGRLGNAFTYT